MLILEAETGRATQRNLIGQKWSLEEPDSWEAEAEEALRPSWSNRPFQVS